MIIIAKVKEDKEINSMIDKWELIDKELETFLSFPKLLQFKLEGEWQERYEEMRSSEDFVYVNIDSVMETDDITPLTESEYPVSPIKWGLDRMSKRKHVNYNSEFSSSNYGANVDLYVLDGGVNYSHPEFSNVASDGGPRARSINHNSATSDPWYYDAAGTDNAQDASGGSSHGTLVAMCAAGKEIGTAKEATVISVRVDLSNSQINTAMDKIIQHHKYKPNRRHSVLNISFGSTFKPAPGGLIGSSAFMVYDASLAEASIDDVVQGALDAGITVTKAAGNGASYQLGLPETGIAGAITAGTVPGLGTRISHTRVFKGPNIPLSSLVQEGDAFWGDYSSVSGAKGGYLLINDLWNVHTIGYSNGSISIAQPLGGAWLNQTFDLASHSVLVKSGIYDNGPYSISDNSYVDVYFTPADPAVYSTGLRSQAVDGSIWVKWNMFDGPVSEIWRRESGAWVDSGNTTYLTGNYGGINFSATGLGSTMSSSSELIVVGASSADDFVSYFSNYGGRVDLYAPGQGIIFPDPYSTSASTMTNTSGQGTSFSAPYVAGLAAIYLNDRTQPSAGGVVSSGSDPASVRSHLNTSASSGLANKSTFKYLDLIWGNHTRPDFGLGGNLYHPTYGKDVFKAWTSGSDGRFISLSKILAGNTSFYSDYRDYITGVGSHKVARLLSTVPTSAPMDSYYADAILGYHPNVGHAWLAGDWDFSNTDIEEMDYSALDATVHDRIAFNTFVDKTNLSFQDEVTDIKFSSLNNNTVFVKAGTHSWSGEPIGRQSYTISSGGLPSGISLGTDGKFSGNVPYGSSSSGTPFTVKVTDDLGGTQYKNYTGSLSSSDYGMKVFDENGNVTFDANTKGHNLIGTFDYTGEGSYDKIFDISALPGMSPANIATTVQLIGHNTYDSWNNQYAAICPIIEKRHSINHSSEELKSHISVSYSLQSKESCFSSNGGSNWSTFKAGLVVRVYVWSINHTYRDYLTESMGNLR